MRKTLQEQVIEEIDLFNSLDRELIEDILDESKLSHVLQKKYKVTPSYIRYRKVKLITDLQTFLAARNKTCLDDFQPLILTASK